MRIENNGLYDTLKDRSADHVHEEIVG